MSSKFHLAFMKTDNASITQTRVLNTPYWHLCYEYL